jgi:hypothetical protein
MVYTLDFVGNKDEYIEYPALDFQNSPSLSNSQKIAS